MKKPPTFARGESLKGLRRKLNALSEAIAERTPERGTGTLLRQRPTGFSYSAGPGGGRFPALGFTVYPAGDESEPLNVGVIPSVVSGMGSVAEIPKIGEASLADDPAPKIALPEGHWIAIKIEAAPTARKETIVTGEGESEMVVEYWTIAEGGGEIESITVETFADEAAMDAAALPATVNPEDGETTSGTYVLPLAKRQGALRQWGYVGPIGVRMCASGHVVAISPARAYYSGE